MATSEPLDLVQRHFTEADGVVPPLHFVHLPSPTKPERPRCLQDAGSQDVGEQIWALGEVDNILRNVASRGVAMVAQQVLWNGCRAGQSASTARRALRPVLKACRGPHGVSPPPSTSGVVQLDSERRFPFQPDTTPRARKRSARSTHNTGLPPVWLTRRHHNDASLLIESPSALARPTVRHGRAAKPRDKAFVLISRGVRSASRAHAQPPASARRSPSRRLPAPQPLRMRRQLAAAQAAPSMQPPSVP